MSHGGKAVNGFYRTAFGEEWFWAEWQRFHTMNDTWRSTVHKIAWPSRVIVRTRMASDIDINRMSKISRSDGGRGVEMTGV